MIIYSISRRKVYLSSLKIVKIILFTSIDILNNYKIYIIILISKLFYVRFKKRNYIK